MHTRFVAALSLVVVAALATGCSSSSSEGDDSGGPVAASPLAGTINGSAFNAKSAIASPSGSGGKMSLSIYDVEASCEKSNPDVDRQILTSVPWTAGTSRNLKLDFTDLNGSQTVTFVVGKSNNIISNSGRIEIIDAPTEKGSTGKIRLRANADGNTVEGEIAVTVCPR